MGSDSSWEKVGEWYDTLVGEEGHYYHQHVVIPRSLRLLDLKKGDTLLDLACGQGVLSRALPEGVNYHGIDLSPTLIKKAKERSPFPFTVADITKKLPLKNSFTHATVLLAIQNIEHLEGVFKNVTPHLVENGTLVVVLNHCCFRIPRQSSWGVDSEKKMQYRRVDRYLSPLKIPIQMHPGKKGGSTWSFHHCLSDYSRFLFEAGFVIELMQEWISDKKSTGKHAKMEDRAREEFPLFLAIKARKRLYTCSS